MKATLLRQVGNMQLSVEVEGKDEKDIFTELEFWSTLPSAHPSGATDFHFSARTAKTGAGKSVKYYEIVCPSADQRFRFGQATDEAGGGLFPKGWEDCYHGNDGDDRRDEREEEPSEAANPAMDAALRKALDYFDVKNPGAEKKFIMEALNLRVGKLATDLSAQEKSDLYTKLRQRLDSQKRKAA